MAPVSPTDLARLLAANPPFDSLEPSALREIADAATVQEYASGDLVLDGFGEVPSQIYVVVSGRLALWNDLESLGGRPDERLGAGGVFGFSAMLTERRVGPRAEALTPAVVAAVPAELVAPAFVSEQGARFLAERLAAAARQPREAPSYGLVDEMIQRTPLVVHPGDTAAEVAGAIDAHGNPCAAVQLPDGTYGLITDAVLRQRILVEGRPTSTPVGDIMLTAPPTVRLGDTAAEALILMLDTGGEFLLVTDRAGLLQGVIAPLDFAVSGTTAGVALHEQLRRARTTDELVERSRHVPEVLDDLLSRGLRSGRVIAVYSAILDTIVRRSIAMVFEQHPDVSPTAFTWLSLGSNGRREAVLSSDVDSAVVFRAGLDAATLPAYRTAFAQVNDVLARTGLTSDSHGVTAANPLFSRTHTQWRAAVQEWLAAPDRNSGAIMTSLLVDGRPIYGDLGLPAVVRSFGSLRGHPGTMRLLLSEALARKARPRSISTLLRRGGDTFDLKDQALVPLLNIARFAALSVGSPALPTPERLQAAAGSQMLPETQASVLVEVFEVLQRLRLQHQLGQHERGEQPTNRVDLAELSVLDRRVISQAVREVVSVQKRMANIAHYVPTDDWAQPVLP